MLIQNKKFKLKDGRYAILRSPREDDAPALLDYLITTAGETDFLIRYPEECRPQCRLPCYVCGSGSWCHRRTGSGEGV